jgi:hypothetical protein
VFEGNNSEGHSIKRSTINNLMCKLHTLIENLWVFGAGDSQGNKKPSNRFKYNEDVMTKNYYL